ncbi:lamin tail domain-containing protein [Micromonospora sp. 4G57]|uniref:Lamin tail domain-containing protein n=1 Tax=Micromonospora sicca TaxID=2202420 RepID=A0ABU5J7J3_9ACTN|nr:MULTISPECIES: lamin tail domain-containing protein [unclassified Micromonospora]MDZ5444646.1 lamin tail domain-containing protein [Micromonospora sp. 4G57]MDZ5488553.1 lamin tail domain-containing protein [Micromonospora sp. 4G53]
MRPRRTIAALATTAAVSITAIGVAPPAASAAPTDLFISEYVEGLSNNKAIELYNGTGAPVDLTAAGYQLQLYFNGATTSTNVALSGTVAAGDVFVFAASSAAPAILAQADQTYGGSLYNGDDAIVLRKGGAVVDSIGQVGVDPGTEWGTGVISTADNTLRRLPTVTAGDTDPSDAFDPAVQWAGFATDTFDGLGSHSVDGGGPVDQPAKLTCGGTLTVEAGATATREVTATDADDTVTDLAVTAVSPSPATGSISRTAVTPASGVGGTATATVTATGLPAGSYTVTVTSTDADGTTATCTLTVQATTVLSVGEVQGRTGDDEKGATDRSPLAPASGNGTSSSLYDVRGVITQKSLTRSSAGADQYGFYLQSRTGTEDGDPLTSDGIFVFMGSFTTLIGGYAPTVGDEVVLRGRVSEFFNQTQLSSASLVRKLDSGLDVDTAVRVDDATPPADAAGADLYWERHEGARMRVRSGSGVSAPRHIFASTADSEIYVVDREDPIMQRADPYARRVFRDAHPLDDIPGQLFDNGNNQRVLLGAGGVKATGGDSGALLPEARTFDTLTEDAYGAISYAFSKYSVQPEQLTLTGGADPSANNPPQPANRNTEVAVATYNLENLYDYRDDPFDGCDFAGNPGCTGVSPPFDYVPASEAAYTERLGVEARQIVNALHSPDLVLVQEAEDQDICSVADGKLVCGTTNDADGAPDTIQELALTIAAGGGPAYAAAYDRTGADARGITSAFLYRTDRLALAEATATDPLLGTTPTVEYRSAGLPANADVQNPKALNAVLPADVDRSTGVDGANVYTRAPQLGKFTVAAAPGSSEHYTLWALSNHFSSGPDSRVGQRREQAAYGAALVKAIDAGDPNARVIYGGDLNVFPRPDDPIATGANPTPSDQLGPLYQAGMHNLWDDLVADVPAAAYSYTFSGQAQTLDNLFTNDKLHDDLVQIRSAHINADYPTDAEGLGDRGASDHDPQVARFRSRASLAVADASVAEGDKGDSALMFTVTVSRPLSESALICATTYGTSAQAGSDYDPYVGCKTLAAGQTSLTFPVTVRGDRKVEADEQLTLYVAGVPGLELADPVAVGTIANDD